MKIDLYVDGSFSPVLQKYGSGIVVLVDDKVVKEFSVKSADDYFNKYHNVAGEVFASILATKYVADTYPGAVNVSLHYDYAGIECWVNGKWSANNSLSQFWRAHVHDLPFKINFVKVRAHTGDPMNELADKLARKAVGLS